MIETCSRRCMLLGTLCLGIMTIVVLILESQLAESLSGHRLKNRTFPTENNSTCYLHQPYTIVSECHPCSDFELKSKIIGVCVHTNFKEVLRCKNGEMVLRSCDRVAFLEEAAFWKFSIWSFVTAAVSSLIVMLRLRQLNDKAMRRARQILSNSVM